MDDAGFMTLVTTALAAAETFHAREVDIRDWQISGFNQQLYTGPAGGVQVREKLKVDFDYWDGRNWEHHTLT